MKSCSFTSPNNDVIVTFCLKDESTEFHYEEKFEITGTILN